MSLYAPPPPQKIVSKYIGKNHQNFKEKRANLRSASIYHCNGTFSW